MSDLKETGHSEPTSLEKADYVDGMDKSPEVNVDELEPVVTPKTWVVVFVSTLISTYAILIVLTLQADLVNGLRLIVLAHSCHGGNRISNRNRLWKSCAGSLVHSCLDALHYGLLHDLVRSRP